MGAVASGGGLGLGLEDVRELFACFYADDGLVAARDPEHLQLAFDLLAALFDRVRLKTNTLKTEAMTFVPLCSQNDQNRPVERDLHWHDGPRSAGDRRGACAARFATRRWR